MKNKRSFYYETREEVISRRWHRADTIIFYFDVIEHYIKRNKIKWFKITYTKEKYGRFDITWMWWDEWIHNLTNALETATEEICVECWAPGILRRRLWWVVPLCWRHYYPRIISITLRKRKLKLINLFNK